MRRRLAAAALFAGTLLAGCSRAPRALVPHSDACDYCLMGIEDLRFGAQLQTRTGRIRVFDSIDCLASYYDQALARNDVKGAWVTDFESARWLAVDSAVFVVDGSVHAPMGRSLMALAPTGGTELEAKVKVYGGVRRTWSEVVALVKASRFTPPTDTVTGVGDTARTSR